MDYRALYGELKTQFAERDERHHIVAAVRRGDVSEVLPGFFPKDLDKQVTANMVDVASRDLGEMLGHLPQISCQPARFTSNASMKFADKRTKVAIGYVENSRLQPQLYGGADGFFMKGALPLIVDIDFDQQTPVIRVDDPVGAYYLRDHRGRTQCYYKRWFETVASLCAKFPEATGMLRKGSNVYEREPDSKMLEVVKYYGKHEIALFVPEKGEHCVLHSVPNPMGKVPVFIAERTKWDDEVRGQFDEMVWVQLIRARLALYAVELADEALNAPTVVPNDINDLALGPRSIIHTNSPPGSVYKVPFEVPSAAFAENALLQQEERVAARYPEGMTGSIDASVITGQGVNALLSTVNTQIKVAQEMVRLALEDAISYCFEIDEKFFADVEKTTQGTNSGAPFSEKYTPSRDVKGDYTVKATYGFASGMDANRALVWALQLRGAGAMSLDTLMRLMGDSRGINPTQELERMDVEAMQSALVQGMAGYAASIPQMTQQGMDPNVALRQIATAIEARQKGKATHEAVLESFQPTPEEKAAAEQKAQDPFAALMGDGPAGAPAPGGGQPDASSMQMMLAGLTAGGQPNLQSSISRMIPTAA